jgi:hypothetical protein
MALPLAIAVTLTSCLITQPVHFDEPPNSPPSITVAAGSLPLTRFIFIPADLMVTADGGTTPTSLDLDVVVFDADIDQTLHYAALLDESSSPCSGCNGDLAPSTFMTGRERRALRVTIPVNQLMTTTADCHRITLIVTGAFESGSATPRDPIGDTATATWWVVVQPNLTDVVDMSTLCPRT